MAEKSGKRNKISNHIDSSIGVLVVLILLAFLVILTAQETFKEILLPLGLYNNRSGALVDCSKPEGQFSRYCNSENKYRQPRQLKNPSESGGFNLFD